MDVTGGSVRPADVRSDVAGGDRPSGQVTYLFTDIEGSTRLWQQAATAMAVALRRHFEIVSAAVTAAGGRVHQDTGDGVFAVFATARDAVGAAVAAQLAIGAAAWDLPSPLRIRIGIHTGEVDRVLGDYRGIPVNRTARITGAAHGGQIVLSDASYALVADDPPADVSFTDLGVHRLEDLARPQRLYQVSHPALRAEFPPPRGTVQEAVLPAEPSSLIGRDAEVAAVLELLREQRLVTLTGPGGTGKTRLSQRVATLAASSVDRVHFVPLGPLTRSELVPAAIASALGLPSTPLDPLEQLRGHLADGTTLLVLDNFEHVLDAAPVVGSILAGAPGVRALVTSRAPLRISGEREYAVPPLTVPARGTHPGIDELRAMSGVSLFIERARSARPDFDVTPDNATAVAALTSSLDGLPLAIELAASWIRIAPVEQLAEQLSRRGLLDVAGPRDVPDRQRSLRAAIEWSCQLIDDHAKALFDRMSVFAGGADLAAIEAVAGLNDVMTPLAVLIEHSLVRTTDAAGRGRYTMLETIRQYAAEQLARRQDAGSTRDAHLRHYHDVVVGAGPELEGSERRQVLDMIDAEIDNVRAALAHASNVGHAREAAEIVHAMWRFWHMRGSITEGRDIVESVLHIPGHTDHTLLAALEAAGGLAYWHDDQRRAEHHYRAAVDAARRTGDEHAVARAEYNLSFPLIFRGRYDEAIDALDRALTIHRSTGDEDDAARVLWGKGSAEWGRSRFEAALESFRQALPAFERSGDTFMLGWTHRMIASSLLKQRDPARARVHINECLQLFAEAGDTSGTIYCLRDLAELATIEGESDRALILMGAVDAAVTTAGLGLLHQPQNALPDTSVVETEVGAERARELLARGRALTLADAIAYATGAAEQP